MRQIVLGVGEIGVCDGTESIKTFALGSCVALILVDKHTGIVGMAHIALPESNINLKKAEELPGYFADTGIEALLASMADKGAPVERSRSEIKLVGGAQIMDTEGTFNIGKRNVLAIKKLLWAKGMAPIAEDVGGNISRTVTAHGGSGRVHINTHDIPEKII